MWRERIADARIKIDQARLLVLHAAWKMDVAGNKAAQREIAMIKVVAPNVACQVIDQAIQLYGGAGVSDDFGLGWLYASPRTLRIADGPDEVHRNHIAKHELGALLHALRVAHAATGQVALVTGAGRGIGRALCREFARRGARASWWPTSMTRWQAPRPRNSAASDCSATSPMPAAVAAMVRTAQAHYGRVDVLVSNAGFGADALDLDDALSAPDERWQRMWDVHVMSHARACRALLPGMLARGSGCLVNVASAAGLLSQVGDTPYSATKHAAVGLAESLAITYGDRGIAVSVVCPQYVATAITGLDEETAGRHVAWRAHGRAGGARDGGWHRGRRFLILTHPEVLGFFQRKASDYDRWVAGMRRLRDGLRARRLAEGPRTARSGSARHACGGRSSAARRAPAAECRLAVPRELECIGQHRGIRHDAEVHAAIDRQRR